MKKEIIYRTFSKIPTIETPRLILRGMRVSDKEDMYEYACRRDVTEYLTWEPHPTIGYTKQYLEFIASKYRVGDFYDWAVVFKENSKMIGTCGFTRFDCRNDLAEVGYVLNPDYWGKGIAGEAVSAVMDFGFNKLQLHRIEARFMHGNDKSRRVMEKCGMRFEGMGRENLFVKNKYVDVGVCAILRNEFENNSRRI